MSACIVFMWEHLPHIISFDQAPWTEVVGRRKNDSVFANEYRIDKQDLIHFYGLL